MKKHQPPNPIVLDEAQLRALQQRAEALVRGEQPGGEPAPSGEPALADLARAIEVLGAHTAQGLRAQHAYIAALSSAQEAERGRLARELHDEVVQQLIALTQAVDRAQRLLERDPALAAERLRTMRASITELVGELRLIIGDLRPPALAELGLLSAVELLLQRRSAGPPAFTLEVTGTSRRLAPQGELALFRIVQEAANNIQRHAQAARASLTFHYGPGALRLTITDDGRGFEPPAPDALPDGHWGLRGMRERAELAGGALTIASAPGRGARLVVQVPYPGVGDRDPVCGMPAGPAAPGAEHAGQLYRFCSPACRDLFLAQPAHYLPADATLP